MAAEEGEGNISRASVVAKGGSLQNSKGEVELMRVVVDLEVHQVLLVLVEFEHIIPTFFGLQCFIVGVLRVRGACWCHDWWQ